jgi:S-adenosylmethionine:diacylglycerol 3-amino-3-carboxypropyl transferase
LRGRTHPVCTQIPSRRVASIDLLIPNGDFDDKNHASIDKDLFPVHRVIVNKIDDDLPV